MVQVILVMPLAVARKRGAKPFSFEEGMRVQLLKGNAAGCLGIVRAVVKGPVRSTLVSGLAELIADTLYVGIELDDPRGKHNGLHRTLGQQFRCAPNHGIYFKGDGKAHLKVVSDPVARRHLQDALAVDIERVMSNDNDPALVLDVDIERILSNHSDSDPAPAIASPVMSDIQVQGICLMASVKPDGSTWDGILKVCLDMEYDDGNLQWYTWSQGSTFGLSGQLDMMPSDFVDRYLAEAAKYTWKHEGTFSEQIGGLCDHYNAPGLHEALSESGWDQLDGKGVRYFQGLEELLRTTWPKRNTTCDCPVRRGFFNMYGCQTLP